MTDEFDGADNAEQPVATDENTEASGTARRGRPRDQAVIERDERVLGALSTEEAKTKSQIAEELGLEPNVVYLSLWRLHKSGLVTREQRAWRQTASTTV